MICEQKRKAICSLVTALDPVTRVVRYCTITASQSRKHVVSNVTQTNTSRCVEIACETERGCRTGPLHRKLSPLSPDTSAPAAKEDPRGHTRHRNRLSTMSKRSLSGAPRLTNQQPIFAKPHALSCLFHCRPLSHNRPAKSPSHRAVDNDHSRSPLFAGVPSIFKRTTNWYFFQAKDPTSVEPSEKNFMRKNVLRFQCVDPLVTRCRK